MLPPMAPGHFIGLQRVVEELLYRDFDNRDSTIWRCTCRSEDTGVRLRTYDAVTYMKRQSDHAYSSTLSCRKTAVILFSIARIGVTAQGGA